MVEKIGRGAGQGATCGEHPGAEIGGRRLDNDAHKQGKRVGPSLQLKMHPTPCHPKPILDLPAKNILAPEIGFSVSRPNFEGFKRPRCKFRHWIRRIASENIATMCRRISIPDHNPSGENLRSMKWPDCWKEHWLVPLHKRNAVFKSTNYRGVHLTPQLSKVVEKLVKGMMEPHLERVCAFGDNQFAYRKERGSRDVVLNAHY